MDMDKGDSTDNSVVESGVMETQDPFDELTELDLEVELARLDEDDRMFDPDKHPKEPTDKEEPTTDLEGEPVPVETELGIGFSQGVETLESLKLDFEP